MPALDGKVAMVTGANTGIGKVTAEQLVQQGAHVFLACRTAAKAQPVVDEINAASKGRGKAEFIPLDLGDLHSVRHCAETFLARDLPLHLLILNAGLAGHHGQTTSGFELTFGTCHVGHFLLTQCLLERLKASTPARVVVVSSKAHYQCKGIDFDLLRQPTQSTTGLKEYSVAKLANVLFAAELGRRLQGTGVTTYALHPGVVASDVWRSVPWPIRPLIKRFMLTNEQGAATSLYCATAPELSEQTGLYYDNCRAVKPSKLALDNDLARRLWDASESWVAQ